MGGARVSAVLVINVMVTTVVRKKKSSRHILHQYNCFGSQPGGAQGNITENSQHLIPSPSFAMTFFVVVVFRSLFFFSLLMKTAPTSGVQLLDQRGFVVLSAVRL